LNPGASSAAEKVAKYRHAQLSAIKLSGDPNAKVDASHRAPTAAVLWAGFPSAVLNQASVYSIESILVASQMRTAFSSIVVKTGSRAPGERLITCNTSAVAVCCSPSNLEVFGQRTHRLGGLEIDHQLELGRLFDRQIGRFGAAQELDDLTGN
jgi:hypothetical protein